MYREMISYVECSLSLSLSLSELTYHNIYICYDRSTQRERERERDYILRMKSFLYTYN